VEFIQRFFLDFLIILVLAFGAYKGYSKGILSELVGFFHFAIAFLLCFKILGIIFNIIRNYVFNFNETVYPEFAFACIVGASFALLASLGKYLKTEIEYDFPGAWDNIIGAAFGLVKMAVVLSFFFWFTSGFGSFTINIKKDSALFPVIENISFTMLGVKNDADLSTAITNALK
jgi:membrane protein required for colicin V production